MKETIKKELEKIISEKFNLQITVYVFPSPNENFGDYTTNVAFLLAKKVKKSPKEFFQIIFKNFSNKQIKKIDFVNGFINFWLKEKVLVDKLIKVKNNQFTPNFLFFGPKKKIVIEYAQPNTHKLFHIGHLRNIIYGESLARIFEFLGNNVVRTNYQGDVGLHIAKTLYAILNNLPLFDKIKKNASLNEKIAFTGQMYTQGNRDYEDEEKKKEIIKINQMIYEKKNKILPLWEETRKWSLDYFEKIYRRVDTRFDRLYFESEMAERGLELCYQALKNKILKKSQGAIVFDGQPYQLHTRVFVNSLGYPTYEGKELALAEKEFSDFGKIDRCFHLTTPEQKSFFEVTSKVEELLNNKMADKQVHLTYEWVNLKTGRMSSREGNIVEANWLIDKIKEKISLSYKTDKETAENIAIASIKYSFLKNSPHSPIDFDIDESINLEGNSGPYLLYSYVRCQSIIKKINQEKILQNFSINWSKLKQEEINLMRHLFLFEEIVYQSGEKFAPNLITEYLYQLAKKFNLFYQKHQVIKAETNQGLRILITETTAKIIKKGLFLLGIKVVEKM